jgi:hypothetical protein
MANYTTLVGAKTVEGSIKHSVNNSLIPATTILEEAEAWIYQRLRVREMIADEPFTFAQDASSTPLSDLEGDFLDAVQFLPWGWCEPLEFRHEGNYRPGRDSSGVLFSGSPCMWTIIGETAYVDVKCTTAFSGQLMYYAQPAPLAASTNETNFLTRRYPTLLRTACVAKAYEWMKDTQAAVAELTKTQGYINEAAVTNDMWRRSQRVSG